MSDSVIQISPVGACRLLRSSRRTLAISVLPDGTVELVAPRDADFESIRGRVLKRIRWIRRQRQEFASMNAHRRILRYCSGATHRYLGRQYRLKVIESTEPSVRLVGGYICIGTPKPGDESKVKTQLEGWYLAHAMPVFERYLASCLRHFKLQGDWVPRLKLLRMPKRWGSCTRAGTILLNPELILAPSLCIQYVITHELCHLKHPNHGPEFYNLLGKVMPEWKRYKARLEQSEAG